ncbi:hypothetical protein [Streptomyces sp. NPDC053726]|uniref:DUF6197 family protein n=1 Tax=Streptomyces sp. NPDC053726 TaxID=3365713 RepID=UPI0037D48D7F
MTDPADRGRWPIQASSAQIDEQGAPCLYSAIRAEAGADRGLESRGLDVLMDAIRRKFGDVDSVPSFNDTWTSGRIPMRMLAQAAGLADSRGLQPAPFRAPCLAPEPQPERWRQLR